MSLYKPLLLDPKNSEAERIFRQQLAMRLAASSPSDTEVSAQFTAGGLLAAVAWWLRIENRSVPMDRLRAELASLLSRN